MGEGASILVRLLAANDADLLASAGDDVFDDAVNPDWAREFLADDRHHIAVALAGEQVVGFASAVHYIHPDKPTELWINEVGVADAYQRQGLGRRLMERLFAKGRELGCGEAWVLTEEDNVAARGLYGSVGGEESAVQYFTFDLSNGA